jgi:chromosomal replication initiation ATPase DnaA
LGGQLRLKLEQPAGFGRDRFIVSDPNREAVQAIDTWPDTHTGALALIGPAGSGKSHLAKVWAERTGARTLTTDDLEDSHLQWPSGPVLVDGADVARHGEAFFHLLNNAVRSDCCVLLTGRSAPTLWPVEVQDLRSRLNALPVVELGEPDDAILGGVLIKFFQERSIRPPQDLLAYLVKRIERSVPAARAVVAALDEAAGADHRPVSRVLARQILKDETDDLDGGASA